MGNIDKKDCKADIDAWYKANAFSLYLVTPLVSSIILIGACCKFKPIFKLGNRLHALTGLLGLSIAIWGWTMMGDVNEKDCVKDPDKQNPVDFMRTFLIFQTVVFGLTFCCFCCLCVSILGVVAAGATMDNQE